MHTITIFITFIGIFLLTGCASNNQFSTKKAEIKKTNLFTKNDK